jgi:hypothetical protein
VVERAGDKADIGPSSKPPTLGENMIISPLDVCEDFGDAKYGVIMAARELGIECNCGLMSQWIVKIDGNERATFLELAKECARSLHEG